MVLLLVLYGATAGAKSIRLRNELIDPASAAAHALMAATVRTNVPGLYLIQFDGALAPARRAELRAAGIELLKYVPDDAFIARLNEISLARVAALPSVTWVGAYRPAHKIHPGLSAALRAAAKTNQPATVSVLLSATATAAEVAAVRTLLASVHSESHLRQGTILRGELTTKQLAALSQSGAVLWIEPAPVRKLFDEAASKIVGGNDGQVATRTLTQQMGFNGTNVTVCVADTGLDTGDTNTLHPDLLGRVTGFEFYGALTSGSDGYGHGTHIAGIIAGDAATGETDTNSGALYGLGVAPGASLFIERIFDDSANAVVPYPSDETLTRDAVQHGAAIGANSWGNNVQGDYDTDAAQFDELVRDADASTAGDQPYVLEFAVGNFGPGSNTISSPATAKNVLSTGASENVTNGIALAHAYCADGPDTMAPFSSRGPCADGRLKPDLVAPGSWIASAASSAAPNVGTTAWAPIDSYYVYWGGTSMSGPHAAGAAAVFMQFYEGTHSNAVPSPALVKAALINSAQELNLTNGGPAPAPNDAEGWGRVSLTNIVTTNVNGAPRYYEYLDQTALLTNGGVYERHLFVPAADQPLKLTLAYTDVPGFPGANPALVNDLDLEVVAPDGTLFRGNQFAAGESVPNPATRDSLNNVEGIRVSQPVPGDYLVRVRATNVVQDARSDTPAIDQDFALVCSGDLSRPQTGFILLDRMLYTAPDEMQMTVCDAARAGSNSVSALVTNLTGHTFMTTTLAASGNYGVFTGAVATVRGTAGAGQIHLSDGDQLAAVYVDSGGTRRTATAMAHLTGPTVSDLTVTNDVGLLTLVWQTSEPATSIVFYGTNSLNLNLSVTNSVLSTNHVVRLSGLMPGATYYFYIVSRDAVGNVTRDDNNDAFYTFTGRATPGVLLVDAYDTAVETTNGGATVIPDSAYTNVLDAAGISYGFWKVNDRGYPQLADLQMFPVVMWRLTDDAVNYTNATNNTVNAPQQTAIQAYVNGGGSFFLASMGALSRLGNVPFRQNVLHVAGFKSNPAAPAPCLECDEDFGVPAFIGASNSLAASLSATLDYGNYPMLNNGAMTYGPDFSDTFTPSSNATAVAFESVSGRPCGMSYPAVGVDSLGRVVFLSFPFDAIPTNAAIALLQNVVSFLRPGANGNGLVMLDHATYATNETVTVEVGDSDLAGAGQTQVTFAASSRTNLATITLSETLRPGLLRGTILLVSGAPATNQLQVQDGDMITAMYFDVSNGSNVTATAGVDTVPPVITEVAAVPSYFSARVAWQTTEPADAAVEYGLTTAPDHSAYVSGFRTNQAVTIGGLAPNQSYFYRVVSRDQVGNVATNDNNGNFYTFQTLPILPSPWFDDLESGSTNWRVVPDPVNGSDLNWALGTPANGLTTAANSGTNAWSSDLNGNQNFISASSYLYTPAIDLTGLKSATLTFSNIFDFSRVDSFSRYLESGSVFVSTNNSGSPTNLVLIAALAGTTSSGWSPETLDLTPFVGQAVQVVFYYQAEPSGAALGWTLDDVGVTGVIAGGDINITKNLGQGTWTLFSLSSNNLVPLQTGVAPIATITNAPPGQYVVQFGNVPYFVTPAAQTNAVIIGGTISFAGNYTFTDVNSNGISDAWEEAYFGEVSTNRTMTTDTIGNGLSDYAKFIAGLNPTNPASLFELAAQAVPSNGFVNIRWPVMTNRLYQVNASDDLSMWLPASDWLQASNNSVMTCTVTNAGDGPQFYRVQVRP